jgi:hypothetical protein
MALKWKMWINIHKITEVKTDKIDDVWLLK